MTRMLYGMSIRLVAGLMLMGCIRDAAPSISSVLARFEPTTLPIAMPPFAFDTRDEAHDQPPGIEVPMPTMVSPMRNSGIPVAFGDRYRAVEPGSRPPR